MTYLMDYGDDWPPPPEPPPPLRRRWSLWRWCLFWLTIYTIVTLGGLAAIHLTNAGNPPAVTTGTATPDKTEAHR